MSCANKSDWKGTKQVNTTNSHIRGQTRSCGSYIPIFDLNRRHVIKWCIIVFLLLDYLVTINFSSTD